MCNRRQISLVQRTKSRSKLIIAVDEPDKSYYRGRFGASVQLPGGFAGFVDYGRLFAYDRWSEYTISGGLRYEF